MPLGQGSAEGVRQYTMAADAISETEPMPKQFLLAELDTHMNDVGAGEVLVVTIKRVE